MIKGNIAVVGAGISGATVARLLAEQGYIVHVYEQNQNVGGACEDKLEPTNESYIQYHGSHIFHTNNKEVWDFVSRFTTWSPYIHKVKAMIDGNLFSLPLNWNDCDKLPHNIWYTLQDVEELELDKEPPYEYTLDDFANSDIDCFKDVADYIFKNVFEYYSTKQWGEIPDKSVLARVKAYRNSYDERYFTDKYQGIPVAGFTTMIHYMLRHLNIGMRYHKFTKEYISSSSYDYIFYSGSVDELMDYKYGELPYRTCKFTYTTLDHPKHQEAAVINYTQNYDFTRTHDYSWYLPVNKAILAKEYPKQFDRHNSLQTRYYPINKPENKELYQKYCNKLKEIAPNVILIGRLGLYQYLDMDKAIAKSFEIVKEFLG